MVLNLPYRHLQSQPSPVTSSGSSCTANSSQNSAVISHGGHSVPAYFSGDNLGFIVLVIRVVSVRREGLQQTMSILEVQQTCVRLVFMKALQWSTHSVKKRYWSCEIEGFGFGLLESG